MPRYVILTHDHPFLHWDLMLESGAALRTWRLAAPPEVGREVSAESLGNHRIAYLDYEGPVSGGRGTVTRWDRGTLDSMIEGDEEIIVELRGERLNGRLALTKLTAEKWRCRYVPAGQG